MKATAVLIAGAVAALTACGGTHPAHHASASPSPITLSRLQACRELRSDIVANGGTPDKPALARIARQAQDAQLAQDARSAGAEVGTQELSNVGLDLLVHDCSQVGVQIPTP